MNIEHGKLKVWQATLIVAGYTAISGVIIYSLFVFEWNNFITHILTIAKPIDNFWDYIMPFGLIWGIYVWANTDMKIKS